MTKQQLSKLLLALMLGILLSGCTGLTAPAATAPLEAVTMKLNWEHGVHFLGFYIAQEQGFYAGEGLIVQIFSRMIGSYPPGTRVRLNSGEEAMVFRVHPSDPTRPFVRILRDDLAEEDFIRAVDLTLRHPKTGTFLRSIESSLAD